MLFNSTNTGAEIVGAQGTPPPLSRLLKTRQMLTSEDLFPAFMGAIKLSDGGIPMLKQVFEFYFIGYYNVLP